MSSRKLELLITLTIILMFVLDGHSTSGMTAETKRSLKFKVVEMFKHAYGSYMDNAFPADELMPLSCKGRYRGSEPSRGDVDDSLGNFTLTLIDTLDTLAVLGDIPEFERAVKLVINTTKFDTDVIVSVFETNIRVLGGLLGGHALAAYLKRKKYAMEWYKDELLSMAKDVGTRLLPAFNTTTGIPYPRINMKHGIDKFISQNYKDTCTACAGTMVLEFAALSRFTGDPVFEEKAHTAMDYLWNQRHRSSDLVGMVINIHSGDWIRRESGVGAGIDSYYEYVLKAYILLGDDTYLTRFNKHYEAIMKYVSQGPMFMDVHMHKPRTNSRNFMDSLLAFWPGLQVLKGDIQPAIQMHEMLYQVMQRHNFLPEAFTSDFHVHWGHHPLRPEFVESTYFLYKATGDPHYLEVGQKVIENLEKHARVPCGFAAIQDVTKGTHEDQMDSYVLAETFKYLYLMYAEKSDILFDVDDYIFTTEAHLLPLSLSRCNKSQGPAMRLSREMYSHLQAMDDEIRDEDEFGDSEHNTCPNPLVKFKQAMNYAQNLRASYQDNQDRTVPLSPSGHQCSQQGAQTRLRAWEFVAGNKDQLDQLQDMGIRLMTMTDGRIQLLHTATEAMTPELAEDGLLFMQEMITLSKSQPQEKRILTNDQGIIKAIPRKNVQGHPEAQNEAVMVQVITDPYSGQVFRAGPALFGYDLRARPAVKGMLQVAEPFKVCSQLINTPNMHGRIAVLERGDCMFVDKARHLQKAGAIGGIVIDHTAVSTADTSPLFAMSGDGTDDVYIPMVFLFHSEGQTLLNMWGNHPELEVVLSAKLHTFRTSSEPANPTADQSADTSSQSEQSQESPHPGLKNNFIKPLEPHVERTLELHPLEDIEESGQYKMKVGTEKLRLEVKMKTSNTESPDALDTDILSIKTMQDGSRQLFFRFDRLQKDNTKSPDLAEIYEELVKTLLAKTNFVNLNKQSEYLSAIARLLEQAFYTSNRIDLHSQELFNELSNELELLTAEELDEKEVERKSASDQSEENESETYQSEETVHSHTVQYSQQFPEIPDAEEINVFQSEGVGVKIKTKIVRPVSEKGETQINLNEQKSYANQEDFEVSQNSKTKEIPTNQVQTRTDGVSDKTLGAADALDLERLESINPVLAEGIINMIDKTTETLENTGLNIENIKVEIIDQNGETIQNKEIVQTEKIETSDNHITSATNDNNKIPESSTQVKQEQTQEQMNAQTDSVSGNNDRDTRKTSGEL